MGLDFNPRAQAPNRWTIVAWGVFLVFYLLVLFLLTSGTLRSANRCQGPQPSPTRNCPPYTYQDKMTDPWTFPRPIRKEGAISLQNLEIVSKWVPRLMGWKFTFEAKGELLIWVPVMGWSRIWTDEPSLVWLLWLWLELKQQRVTWLPFLPLPRAAAWGRASSHRGWSPSSRKSSWLKAQQPQVAPTSFTLTLSLPLPPPEQPSSLTAHGRYLIPMNEWINEWALGAYLLLVILTNHP